MIEVPAKMSRDVTWMTQTCTLGYDVIGKGLPLEALSTVLFYIPDYRSQRTLQSTDNLKGRSHCAYRQTSAGPCNNTRLRRCLMYSDDMLINIKYRTILNVLLACACFYYFSI